MNLLVDILLTCASLVMLYFGGEFLIRGATALAARLAISSLAIGLTVVAFGTSAPELVVSMNAVLSDANDVSVGNVVGSNIANVALILGLAALILPFAVDARIVRVHAPIMIAASLALTFVLADGSASRAEGALLLLLLAGYIAFTFWEAGREPPPVQQELASAAPHRHPRAPAGAALVVLGLALLIAGGDLFVTAAVDLASAMGVSQAAVGLTIVAVGTSLPELATSVLAAVRGHGNIAIGNVVGSNIFNILGILGVTAAVHPLALGGISWVDLGALLGLAILVGVQIVTGNRLSRVEGAVLLVLFVVYTTWRLGV